MGPEQVIETTGLPNVRASKKERNRCFSNKDSLYNLAMDVGQTVMPALETIGQSLVINPEAIKNRRLQIMHMNRVLDNVEGEIIGLAVGDPRLDSTTSQPDGKAFAMVIAAIVVVGEAPLAVNGTSELASPNDQ